MGRSPYGLITVFAINLLVKQTMIRFYKFKSRSIVDKGINL